jgi:hypothetical protein
MSVLYRLFNNPAGVFTETGEKQDTGGIQQTVKKT